MGELSPWHWAILIVVLVALFGAKKLPDAARGLGRSVRILKAELGAADEPAPQVPAPQVPAPQAPAPQAPADTAPLPAVPAVHPDTAPLPVVHPDGRVGSDPPRSAGSGVGGSAT